MALLCCGGAEYVHQATSQEARGVSGGDGLKRPSIARGRGCAQSHEHLRFRINYIQCAKTGEMVG